MTDSLPHSWYIACHVRWRIYKRKKYPPCYPDGIIMGLYLGFIRRLLDDYKTNNFYMNRVITSIGFTYQRLRKCLYQNVVQLIYQQIVVKLMQTVLVCSWFGADWFNPVPLGLPLWHWDRPSVYEATLMKMSNSWWRHQMGKCLALLAICEENLPVSDESPTSQPTQTKASDAELWCFLWYAPEKK